MNWSHFNIVVTFCSSLLNALLFLEAAISNRPEYFSQTDRKFCDHVDLHPEKNAICVRVQRCYAFQTEKFRTQQISCAIHRSPPEKGRKLANKIWSHPLKANERFAYCRFSTFLSWQSLAQLSKKSSMHNAPLFSLHI